MLCVDGTEREVVDTVGNHGVRLMCKVRGEWGGVSRVRGDLERDSYGSWVGKSVLEERRRGVVKTSKMQKRGEDKELE